MTSSGPRAGPGKSFSFLIRRAHLYLALFLSPWLLMYAASTCTMNHRVHIGHEEAPWQLVSESVYEGTFGDGASADHKAQQILLSLGRNGPHRVHGEGTLTIRRTELDREVKIVFQPEGKSLRIEERAFDTPAILEQLHRRRGYQHDYIVADLWAATVDLLVLGMLFLALSGLWMWWELRTTRRLGAIFLVGGLGLFVLLMGTI
jgi:hypothetical protein